MQKEIRHRGGPVAGQAIRSTTSTDDEDSNSKALRTPEPSAWGVRDWPYFIAVFVIAMFTRFYRLTEPAGVVFDVVCFRLCTIGMPPVNPCLFSSQVHFGKFTNWYLKRWFSFDIHPPLGKLTFMAGEQFSYSPCIIGWLLLYCSCYTLS